MLNKSTVSQAEITARYQRAEKMDQGIGTKQLAFNTTIYPHWVGDSDYFWYVRDTKSGQGVGALFGREYRLVNAENKNNTPAFDHQALAAALMAASDHKTVDANNLPLDDLEISLSPLRVSFTAFDKRWCYFADSHTCEAIQYYPKDWKISPDGQKAAFVRDHNIWLRDLTSDQEKALTKDGERFFVYAGAATVYGRQELAVGPDILWSPDSKRLLTQVIDTRKVERGAPLVEHVPRDGSLRPKIINADRRVAFPGDEHIECYQILAIDIESGVVQMADYRPCPVFYPPYSTYFVGGRGWWDADGQHGYFIDQALGGKVLNVVKFDTLTGKTQVLFKDTSDAVVTPIPVSHINTLLTPLPASNELIWFSERSGWAHLYLYDMASGELKRPITEGEWLVRNVLRFDAERRELFIQTAGRVVGRNPYYCDICRVNIDTGELTPLLSTDHEYVVCDQDSRIVAFQAPNALGVSPSGDYVVTTRSRVDECPVSLLLDLKHDTSTTLEVADISGLPENWQWPEPVMLKAADQHTDIYGVVFRPSDFSPDNSYPIIDLTYYYSAPTGSFSNSNIGPFYWIAAAYAELGFIVVMFNNRGNEGLRDVTFNTYQDPKFVFDPLFLLKYNRGDCIAGIKQLAERHPYMDLDRVGTVAPISSVAAGVGALLIHPEFYKVGVSLNPLIDSRSFAACGADKASDLQLEHLASNLQGKLLLIHGMLDDVLSVSHTLRLAEALQKANKRFDMLLLPNLAHGSTAYTKLRSWDYVVEHLLGIEPPEDFKLSEL